MTFHSGVESQRLTDTENLSQRERLWLYVWVCMRVRVCVCACACVCVYVCTASARYESEDMSIESTIELFFATYLSSVSLFTHRRFASRDRLLDQRASERRERERRNVFCSALFLSFFFRLARHHDTSADHY